MQMNRGIKQRKKGYSCARLYVHANFSSLINVFKVLLFPFFIFIFFNSFIYPFVCLFFYFHFFILFVGFYFSFLFFPLCVFNQ